MVFGVETGAEGNDAIEAVFWLMSKSTKTVTIENIDGVKQIINSRVSNWKC
jgi:hypothetical protein